MGALLRFIAFLAVAGGLVFSIAGRWDLPFFWAILLLLGGYMLAVSWLLDPELGRERRNPAAAGPDCALRALLGLMVIAHLVVAALDVGRLHWSDTAPVGLRVAGVLGYAASLAFVLWAMRTNRFFIRAVRLQPERGQQVVSAGPYVLVRHPGYLGSATGGVFGGLALGSWLAFVPLLGAMAVLIARTAFEDRFLHAGLARYAEYGRRPRYRLVLGVW